LLEIQAFLLLNSDLFQVSIILEEKFMMPVKIARNVYCICVQDWDRKLFDALIPLPNGTSYNSYIVKGLEKTVLIDTAEPAKEKIFMAYLKETKDIDYVVCNHAEQDHSGLLPKVLEKYPKIKIVTNIKCKELLKEHLHIAEDKFQVIKDGEILDIGGKTLQFVFTPWAHWPETMCTYLKEDKILFSCDLFGSHLATGDVFSNDKKIYEPLKRYYAEIMMPFRNNLKENLKKLDDLAISMIAPSHGPVHKDVDFVLDSYEEWTLKGPKNRVLIAYVSMHGSTEILVERLADSLRIKDIPVEISNVADSDIGKIAEELVDCATVVIGTPTVLAAPHPKVASIAYLANVLRPSTKFISIIGSYGWGGKTIEVLSALLCNVKAEILPPVMVKGLPTEKDLSEIDKLAKLIVSKHKTLEK
jgi:flavorubredoxin